MDRHCILPRNEIHIWQADLSPLEATVQQLSSTLSADENSRAKRYVFPHLQRRFVVARGILRVLLGAYFGVVPNAIKFCYGDFGKPALEEPSVEETFGFNLSHTDDFALFAFSSAKNIGIDVERIHTDTNPLLLAETFFSKREYADLFALPEVLHRSAFYACWTRKEAFLKATGSGIARDLTKFDVSVSPVLPAQLLSTEMSPHEAQRWRLQDIPVPEEFRAALAVPSQDWRLKYFSWQNDFCFGTDGSFH